MLQRRNSKQRMIIREFLKDRYDHPTADKLFNEIKGEQIGPAIPLKEKIIPDRAIGKSFSFALSLIT